MRVDLEGKNDEDDDEEYDQGEKEGPRALDGLFEHWPPRVSRTRALCRLFEVPAALRGVPSPQLGGVAAEATSSLRMAGLWKVALSG